LAGLQAGHGAAERADAASDAAPADGRRGPGPLGEVMTINESGSMRHLSLRTNQPHEHTYPSARELLEPLVHFALNFLNALFLESIFSWFLFRPASAPNASHIIFLPLFLFFNIQRGSARARAWPASVGPLRGGGRHRRPFQVLGRRWQRHDRRRRDVHASRLVMFFRSLVVPLRNGK